MKAAAERVPESKACTVKEKLRWVRVAQIRQAAKSLITHFLRHARQLIGYNPVFEKAAKGGRDWRAGTVLAFPVYCGTREVRGGRRQYRRKRRP